MATSRDVAQAANVSVATVSYVFTPEKSELISSATRERVLKAAAELGYKPSPIGRSLSNRRTYKIGVLFSRHCRSSISKNQLHILHALSRQIVHTEYDLSIYFGWDEKFRTRLENHALDGIMIIGNLNTNDVPDQIAQFNIPMIVINRRYRCGKNIGVVDSDYVRDARKWVRQLAERGAKRIFSVSRNSPYSGNSGEIQQGITQECTASGLTNIIVSSVNLDWLGAEDYHDAGFIMFGQHLPEEEAFNKVVLSRSDARQIFASTIIFTDQIEHAVHAQWHVTDAEAMGNEAWEMMMYILNHRDAEGTLKLIPTLSMEDYRNRPAEELLPHDF